MAIQSKQNGIAVAVIDAWCKPAGTYVKPVNIYNKMFNIYLSILAPYLKRAPQLAGNPIVGQPVVVDAPVFYGIGNTITYNTFVNGVLVGVGNTPYTPVVGDIGKPLYITFDANNSHGVAHGVCGARVVVAALPVPVLWEPFDSEALFAFPADSIHSIDTVDQVQGTGCLKISGTGSGTNTTLTATKTTASVNPAALGVLAMCMRKFLGTNTTGPQLNVARAAAGNTLAWSDSPTKFKNGNHWVSGSVATDFPAVAALPVGTLTIKPAWQQIAPYTTPAIGSFDALFYNAGGRPRICLSIDDFTASAYTNAYPSLRARDMAATFFIPSGQVGIAGKSTWAQAREMENGGMEFGTNTRFDVAYNTFATPALYGDDLVQCRADCLANGLSARALYMLALSNGVWADAYLDELVSRGWKMARTTEPQGIFTRFNFGDQAMTMPSFSITGSVTLAAAQAQVQLAINRCQTQIFHTHDLSDSPTGIGWAYTAKWIPFLDYLFALRAAGTIDLVVFSQLWELDGSALVPQT